MKYQFFLREQPTRKGGSQSYLVIVPANTAEAMAQTTMQALITRHQMHTCVNLPFGNGYKVSFRLSYCEMDGLAHPLLVIVSSEFGAFKLPFEAGRKGYLHFHQTYNHLKVRLHEHHNRKLKRLANENGQTARIEYQQEMHGGEAVTIRMAANGGTRQLSGPSVSDARRTAKPNMKSGRHAANEPVGKSNGKTRNQREKTAWPLKASSPWLNLLKWTTATMVGGTVLIILVFGASAAFADEPESTDITGMDIEIENQDNGFNGFPIPKMDLAMIKAKESAPCSVPGFDASSLSGLQTGDNNEF